MILKQYIIAVTALSVAIGFFAFAGRGNTAMDKEPPGDTKSMDEDMITNLDIATFAGGCFWCTEADFEKVKGVRRVISGYTGGHRPHPSYKEVSGGGTGHAEAVQVYFDPGVVSYRALVDYFWRHINPTDAGGQFVDRGDQYRSEIFYHDHAQKQEAAASKKALEASMVFDKPIVTAITRFKIFYPAEEYHQDYYKKNPVRYKYYRWHSGRDQFIKEAWKDADMKRKETQMAPKDKTTNPEPVTQGGSTTVWTRPPDAEIKKRLTPMQYKITQKEGTEPPFQNAFWDSKEQGIYVDIVSGEPLFSSADKFKSGTGWPSFTRPLDPDYIVEKTDKSLFMVRTEVRSRIADSHLGHVFDDGPAPTGLRYCINSGALRFVPKERLAREGYGKYVTLFDSE